MTISTTKLWIDWRAQGRVPRYAVIENNRVIECAEAGDSARLADLAKKGEVTVLVPSSSVLMASVHLPKMSRSRLQQALPFALEEHSFADIDTLHLALGEMNAEGAWAVAVVSREILAAWLAELRALAIMPQALIPFFMALPWTPGSWTLWLDYADNQMTVRYGDYQGVACEAAALPIYLAALSREHWPEAIRVYHVHQAGVEVPALCWPEALMQHPLKQEQVVNQPEGLALLSTQAPAFTLLQGVYAVKTRQQDDLGKKRRIWMWAVVIWLMLLGLKPLVSYRILHRALAKVDQHIAAIYKDNFPEATQIVAPKLRMQAKWQAVREYNAADPFLLLLSKVSVHLGPTIQVERLDFQQNQLHLALLAGNTDALTQLIQALNADGLTVEQQNVGLTKDGLKASLVISDVG